ncbi:ketosteroid isomerase-related protein [Pseudoxanthomonas sp.]|uniref:ketosteroid isomerase-related protein n=1 Tax=Pseudoxanthomonas sp. TaxID=1871049 RepID=UPI00258D1E15|nr:ketosteroid isomerase-related protein [Pseudoxanthomonas sp.]MCR6686208.1 nuclear transport factor 2 family protein [Pseudoxanthomonas sp.]
MRIDGTRRQDRATELVLAYYAAFNRGDRQAMLALLADDVVHDLNQGARESGKPAFAAFMQRMDASYRERLEDIVVLASPDGERAAAEYVVHGQYLKDDEGLPPARGQEYVLPGGAFFDIRGERIARVSNYYNLQDWIAQVSG